MNHIGVDCHSVAGFAFAVVNERGDLVCRESRPMSGKEFLTFVRGVPKPRRIYIEEGELAGWLTGLCAEAGETLIVADPKRNAWIAKSDQSDDPIDALKLAQLGRGGYLKPVHHPTGDHRWFKELVMGYHDTVQRETRLKNQLKAKFRQNGHPCQGSAVFDPRHRDEWLGHLPEDPRIRLLVTELWAQLDQTGQSKQRLEAEIRQQSQACPEIKRFQDIKGIGLIHAATLYASMVTPARFRDKRQVWKFAGLAVVSSGSGIGKPISRLNRNYNRRLKNAIIKAARSAIRSADNPYRQQYLRLTIEKGILPHRAILTVARSMLADIYGMWKRGTEYDPTIRAYRHNASG